MTKEEYYELSIETYDLLDYLVELVDGENTFEALIVSVYKLEGEGVKIMEARIVTHDLKSANKFVYENENLSLKIRNILGHSFNLEVENFENFKYGIMTRTNRRAAKDAVSGNIVFDRNGKITEFAELVASKLKVRPYENVFKIKMPECKSKTKK